MNEISSFKNYSDAKSFVTQLTSPYTQSARVQMGEEIQVVGLTVYYNYFKIYIYIYCLLPKLINDYSCIKEESQSKQISDVI